MTTALVTGASGGIGLEIARLLAPDHDLVLVARSGRQLDQLAEQLGGARTLATDLAQPGAAARVAAEAPVIDILVNNAGVGDYGLFADADPGKLTAMVNLNVTALTALTRAYLPAWCNEGAAASSTSPPRRRSSPDRSCRPTTPPRRTSCRSAKDWLRRHAAPV